MNDERFWKIVEFIDWPREDYEDINGVPVKNLISDYRTYFKKSENEL